MSQRGGRVGLALALVGLGAAGPGSCRSHPTGRRAVDAGAEAGRAFLVPAPRFAPPEPPRGKQLTLLYASNVHGEYEHCGCPVHPLGGLGRRAAEVDKIRADSDGVISVDAGDLFLPPATPIAGWIPPAPAEVERRARLLAAAYARLGMTAFTPGERDLAIGPALLRRVLADAKVPVVSANLVDRRGQRLFDADRLVEVAGVKVGIFGVTASAPTEDVPWRTWGIEARDPAAAAREEIASLRARGAQIVIALVHVGGTPDSKKLLAEAPGIDWAVLGHSGMNLEVPEEVIGARMLEAMMMGKNLGRLDLHVIENAGAVRFTFADRGARAQLQTILADHRLQIAEYQQRLPTTVNQVTLHDYYAKRVVELRRAVERETARLAATPERITGSWFDNRIIPLDTAVPDQPGVATLVAAYNRESDRLAAAGKRVGVAAQNPEAPAPPVHAAAPSDAPPVTASYAGTGACGGCHQPALKFWQGTKHAHALETLAKTHRERSPACVGCHVTGYLQPGGTADLTVATSRLRDVGCEACHGPGTAHVTSDHKKTSIRRKVGEAVCLGCHTPDQTNNGFDYPAFLGAIVGPGHGQAPQRQ
jgi:2',3'-cyclic-nucleotide 2'-phosphodiesterase (5'-nucleotidase family)